MFRRPRPESLRALLLASLVSQVACVDEDGSTASTTSGEAESGAPGSTGPGPTGDSSGDATAGTGSGDGSSGSGDATSVADETSDSGGPACDPSAVTEVRGCPETIGEGFCSEGAEHVRDGTEIPWMSDPPHSGPHYPMWETWGEHDSSVPRGNWVHNLEHGGIVLSYLCPGGCDAELEVLRAVMEARPDLRILMTSDPLLPGPRFAAISWTWVYRTDAPDLDTLLCFVDQHENHAPEDVP